MNKIYKLGTMNERTCSEKCIDNNLCCVLPEKSKIQLFITLYTCKLSCSHYKNNI